MPWADEEKQKKRSHADGGEVDQYTTALTPEDAAAFQVWKQKYAPHDSGYDYDLQGAYKAGFTPDPQTGHFDDRFKKPNHPTFSTFSQYAKDRPDLAGTWEGDQYIPPATAHYAKGGKVGKARGDFFTIPRDALVKLGHGDIAMGLAALHDTLGTHVLSGPLGLIDSDTVTAIGGGDHAAGRRILRAFISRIRNSGRPPPGHTVIIRGRRAGVAINVNHR